MLILKKILLLSTIFSVAMMPFGASACTGIFLKTATGTYIHARTLEFGIDLKSQILFMPRNYECRAQAPSGKREGLKWKTKYAAVGANAFDLFEFIDGVNEKGLSGGLFYFPSYAGYQEIQPLQVHHSLPMWQVLTWILTSFATVAEVKKALEHVYISDVIFAPMNQSIPAHLIVHDAAGNSIVIECIDGTLHVHDNPLGIITNSPDFMWHMTNLRNYLNLSPQNAVAKNIAGVTFAPYSQGSGLIGLPGDFTSPSRFVRATLFTYASQQPADELSGIYQAFRILHNFDIPKGSVIDESGTREFTTWTSACDTKNIIFYMRPHANFQVQKIELMKLHMHIKKPTLFSVQHTDTIIDVAAK